MKVLVTGGCGFIGSHMVRQLLADGWQVTNLDNLTYASNPANLASVVDDPGYRFVHGDICDAPLVKELVAGQDLVLNFAAETHVDRSLLGPAAFVRANVEGVVCLLEAIRADGHAELIQMSTDEVFGSVPDPEESAEDRPFRPSSPYSASKAAAELQVAAYRTTYGLPVTVLRGCNVYGPNQHLEKFIPLFAARSMRREPLPLYGDGLQQREWIHVSDLIHAISVVIRAGSGTQTGAIHIGSGERRTNLEIARQICDLNERPRDLIAHVEDRAGHDRRYALDSSRLRALGWAPEVPFEHGLARTVAWYVENSSRDDPAFASYLREQYEVRLAGAANAAK